jgi:hypothetical protein
MLDSTTDTFALPIWAVAVSAALFAAAGVLAFVQNAAHDALRTLVRTGLVFAGVVLVVWVFLDRSAEGERDRERRALEGRMSELAIRALTPGSPLACLDAIAGDAVETACERALFSNPEVTASAVSYIAERLNLLAYGLQAAGRGDRGYGSALLAMRQSLESDRFGIVAQVLSLRDSCTPAQCDTLALLRDTSRVRANLRDRTFDAYVARYAANWSEHVGQPVADAVSSGPTTTGSIGAPNGAPATAAVRPAMAPLHYDFPSASSIPAVSIMTPEPETTAARTPAASPPAASNGSTSQRKPSARAATAPTRATASPSAAPSVPPVPPAPSSSPSVEAGPTVQ